MGKGVHKLGYLQREIPAFLTKPIGQIIVKWSYLEYRLSMVIWKLLGVDQRFGRLAVADPRAQQKLEIVRDLFFLRGKVLDESSYKRAFEAIDEIQAFRDLLAHGVWVVEDGDWKVLKFSGTLPDQTLPKIERKRKIKPESFHAKPDGLSKILATLDSLIKAIETFDKVVASLDIPQKQSETAGQQAPAHKPSKHQPQPKPSQGK